VEGMQQYTIAIRPQSSSASQHTFRSCNSSVVLDAQHGAIHMQQGTIARGSVRIVNRVLRFYQNTTPQKHICCLKV